MDSKGTSKRKAAAAPAAGDTLDRARAVGVEAFVEARAFEINALQRSLDDARGSGNARAFQTLARHLRRRAASHNVKRVPARMRARAAEEMRRAAGGEAAQRGGSGGSGGSRHKRRRTQAVRDEYARRQTGKRWLETHVWHAKRMHMRQAWGAMVADTPHARSHRAAYRAAKEHCHVQDVSYYATLELAGRRGAIAQALAALAAPATLAPAVGRCCDGARLAPLTLHRAHAYPRGLLGPAAALWQPAADGAGAGERVLWLRMHPALAADVGAELAAVAGALAAPGAEGRVHVRDISADVVAFELLGPRSTPLLAAALAGEGAAADAGAGVQTLRAVAAAPSPAVLPEGAVLALRIHDPRLRFPPRVAQPADAAAGPAALEAALRSWPAAAARLASGDAGVFDRAACAADVARRPSDHALNQRRHALLAPGSRLAPGAADVSLPLLLVRTGPEAALGARTAAADAGVVDAMAHGWTLLAPRGWAMALWLPLVFAGARAQGLQERMHVSLEAGHAAFPRDWPGCPAYDAAAAADAAQALARWLRRPPGKRTNYAHHGVDSPFFAPFHRLLGMPGPPPAYPRLGPAGLECRMRRLKKIGASASASASASAGAEAEMADSAEPTDSASIWLVTGERLAAVVQAMLAKRPPAATLRQWAAPLLAAAAAAADSTHASDSDADALLGHCLVRVRLTCSARGVPAANAPVCLTTDSTEPIGYVTAGSFSLARGCAVAIAACSLQGLFSLAHVSARSPRKLVAIRSMNGSPECEATLAVIP
ncbi:Ribonucleases P/MRP protein subunit pop1 [Coemansia erecta]|uniref:Ribonucleases P/MRP protein subunit pop1 n=1 Tax=Coemansia erecta TaxID=147472 RepID=A0A9W7Y0F3_9FUNG|nr:Ribonucleases P/MRP protein subunit pop1 [Coemansia erecta]